MSDCFLNQIRHQFGSYAVCKGTLLKKKHTHNLKQQKPIIYSSTKDDHTSILRNDYIMKIKNDLRINKLYQ